MTKKKSSVKSLSKKKTLLILLGATVVISIIVVVSIRTFAAWFGFSNLVVKKQTTNLLQTSGYLVTTSMRPVNGAYVTVYACNQYKVCPNRWSVRTDSNGFFMKTQIPLNYNYNGYMKYYFNGVTVWKSYSVPK